MTQPDYETLLARYEHMCRERNALFSQTVRQGRMIEQQKQQIAGMRLQNKTLRERLNHVYENGPSGNETGEP